ncbi:U-box domain-containing protein 26-like isoform X2 [Arachis hypogaea]|uniref:U-box domain-containing protein 26-like isoform X2 n=1 Tax=Arachis hypogaea TaxID=3818 RepID=UPI003B226A3C|nr:U-box domain-containing protein [Arachis hypogaea]
MSEPEMTIPHVFRCPISLDLFEDPVTLCTGQTYDRSSIEKWLGTGNLICPVTMQKLHDPSIVPNHTLRHLIHQWLQLGPPFHPGNSATIDSLAALKHTLQSQEDDTLENKLQVLEKINVFFSGNEITQIRGQNKKLLTSIAMGIAVKLLELESGRETLVSHPNGVDTLVKLVFSVKCDQDCSDSAVEALSIVCGDYISAREQAIGAGVMTKLLLLMQSHCATTTKSKTRMLLKLLKSKWVQVPK